MKNAKISLVELAIVIAIITAFTTKTHLKPSSKDPKYFWFDPTVTTFWDQETANDEAIIQNCFGSILACSKGYTVGQLNNPNDPSQGVKDDQLSQPTVILFKNQ